MTRKTKSGRSLSRTEKAELLACKKKGYTVPRMTAQGSMNQRQWQAWNTLQAKGLVVIEGMGEADDIALTSEGRQVVAALKEKRNADTNG